MAWINGQRKWESEKWPVNSEHEMKGPRCSVLTKLSPYLATFPFLLPKYPRLDCICGGVFFVFVNKSRLSRSPCLFSEDLPRGNSLPSNHSLVFSFSIVERSDRIRSSFSISSLILLKLGVQTGASWYLLKLGLWLEILASPGFIKCYEI